MKGPIHVFAMVVCARCIQLQNVGICHFSNCRWEKLPVFQILQLYRFTFPDRYMEIFIRKKKYFFKEITFFVILAKYTETYFF